MSPAQKRVAMVKAISSLILGGYLIANVKGLKGKTKLKIDPNIHKNEDFKKIYDELVGDANKRKFKESLSIEEEVVIRFYTNESYFKFNQALLNGSKSPDIIAIKKLLNETLEKLPSQPGEYFRGIGKNEITKLNKMKIGDEITYPNFVSSSIEMDIAINFATKNSIKTGEAAIVIIRSKNGKNIRQISDADFEAEILHKSGSTFILKEVKENHLLNTLDHQFGDMPGIYGNKYILEEK